MAGKKSNQGTARRKKAAPAASTSSPSPTPVVPPSAAEVDAAISAQGGPDSQHRSRESVAFDPKDLNRTVIAVPLLVKLAGPEDAKARTGLATTYDIIIDLNLDFPGGRRAAHRRVSSLVKEILQEKGISPDEQGIYDWKSKRSEQYVFAKLRGDLIQLLVQRDQAATLPPGKGRSPRAIYRIWPDFEVRALTVKSVSTVKADAARNAFGALGAGIVWAVLDSGVDGHHPHFDLHCNLDLDPAVRHRDFTAVTKLPEQEDLARALTDFKGHGTHVAGIIAGQSRKTAKYHILAQSNELDESGNVRPVDDVYDEISGMAPKCQILSLKVLNDDGTGSTSSIMAALDYIQQLNGNGRRLLVHGVNLSVGYDFEPKWFACGQSPLCVEVDRLVRSGVVVVVAAGNTGYGWNESAFRGTIAAGMDLTINDPGNADLAITVGSTHREMPHVYGVSYFSSKGPTGDGRMKPDLVAPGEKIISCASSKAPFPLGTQWPSARKKTELKVIARYAEDSGTSMAAPHVSGVIASFLSIRREFIGRPDHVKQVFLDTATDLKRTPTFQGRGLVDLMRAIQSV